MMNTDEGDGGLDGGSQSWVVSGEGLGVVRMGTGQREFIELREERLEKGLRERNRGEKWGVSEINSIKYPLCETPYHQHAAA